MPGSPTALVEYGQIRWVQKQQMECLVTDAAVEKAAKADPMQARLRLLRPALIQLHAVTDTSCLPKSFRCSNGAAVTMNGFGTDNASSVLQAARSPSRQ